MTPPVTAKPPIPVLHCPCRARVSSWYAELAEDEKGEHWLWTLGPCGHEVRNRVGVMWWERVERREAAA